VKPVVWLGDSLHRLREFPAGATRIAGYELERVQSGREPKDWKPMPIVGLGVNEIRARIGDEYRLFYVAKFVEAVYVLHAFQKKSQKTSLADINVAQRRYRELLEERRGR
jgi:phage-related protein